MHSPYDDAFRLLVGVTSYLRFPSRVSSKCILGKSSKVILGKYLSRKKELMVYIDCTDKYTNVINFSSGVTVAMSLNNNQMSTRVRAFQAHRSGA